MRKKAVFVLTHNEKVFLPIWLKYYSRYFDKKDIYVIDHDSNDSSVDVIKKYGVNHHIEHNDTFSDNDFLTGTIKKWQKKLLSDYEYVLYADADELVIPDPEKYRDIADYIDRTTLPYMACRSRSICQHPDEPDIDLTKPLLEQRKYWFEEELWNKVLLSNQPLDWKKGLHFLNDWSKLVLDEDLYLVHLHRLDYNVVKEKRESFDKEVWGGKGDESFQHKLRGEELKHWFFNPPIMTPNKTEHLVEEIPERFKKII